MQIFVGVADVSPIDSHHIRDLGGREPATERTVCCCAHPTSSRLHSPLHWKIGLRYPTQTGKVFTSRVR